MKLLLSGCAIAALVVGVASRAEAQVAVQDSPIHAIPASDSQLGPLLNGSAAPQAAVSALAPAPVAQAAPPPSVQPPALAVQPMVMADASPVHPAAAPSETALIASLTPPPKPVPAVLTADESAFFNTLGHRITDSAVAYDGYVRHAAAIDPGFSDPASVQRAVRSGSDYQPQQLQQGIVAYAAMISLRSPAFVEGVRAQAAADPGFADRLSAQPAAVLQIPGAPAAAMDVASVLHAHGLALQSTGRAIAKAAYDVQAQAWSKTPVANPVEVLAGVKAEAAEPRTADATSEKALLQSLVSAPRGDGAGVPSATPAVVRGMALAALAVMGRAGDKEDLRVQALLQDQLSAECLKMATLNTNQCLAAAGPHYDDVFCVGEHSVGETARCVASAADGGPGLMQPDPGLRVAEADTERGRAYGPQQAAATPPQQIADAAPYPQGDGTLNGQIYARRAQQQAQPQQTQQQQVQPEQQQQQEEQAPPVRYAYQDAPPPAYQQPAYQQPAYRQPAYQQPAYQQPAYQSAPAPYGYYGGQGGGYAPYGYYPPQAYAGQGYAGQGYPAR